MNMSLPFLSPAILRQTLKTSTSCIKSSSNMWMSNLQPQSFKVTEIPVPEVAEDEVLIKGTISIQSHYRSSAYLTYDLSSKLAIVVCEDHSRAMCHVR